MLFRRREPAGIREKLEGLFWPRKGFIRPFRYFRMRILRLTASPHAVAAGVAAGVASSFTPFIGFHFFISFAIAYLLAGNMIAAALGTAFGNPLTFPLIWASTWEVGHFLLGGDGRAREHLDLAGLFHTFDLAQLWGPVLEPMLVGALPLGIGFALAVYAITHYGVKRFQARRRARLAARARSRLLDAVEGAATV